MRGLGPGTKPEGHWGKVAMATERVETGIPGVCNRTDWSL